MEYDDDTTMCPRCGVMSLRRSDGYRPCCQTPSAPLGTCEQFNVRRQGMCGRLLLPDTSCPSAHEHGDEFSGLVSGNRPALIRFHCTTHTCGECSGCKARDKGVVQKIIDLWNNEGGWIPGAAYEELARLLGVSTDRLTHYDQSKPEGQRRHTVLGPRQIARGDTDE